MGRSDTGAAGTLLLLSCVVWILGFTPKLTPNRIFIREGVLELSEAANLAIYTIFGLGSSANT